MKVLSICLALLAASRALAAQSAPAQGSTAQDSAKRSNDLSRNITIATEYAFRGISQSAARRAFQGSFEFGHPVGGTASLLIGSFNSTVDFSDGGEATWETSDYLGFKWQDGPLSWKTIAYYDLYPGASSSLHYNYFGFDNTLNRDFGIVVVTAEADVIPNFFANSRFSPYLGIDTAFPLRALPYQPTLDLHAGRQTVGRSAAFGAPSYDDWAVELNGDIRRLHLAARYSNTDLRLADCFGGQKICRARTVLSLTWNF